MRYTGFGGSWLLLCWIALQASGMPASDSGDLKVRLSWGHRSPSARPYYVKLVPADSAIQVLNASGDSLEPGDGFKEQPCLFGRLAEGRDQPREHLGGNRRSRMADQISQPPPPIRFGAVDGGANTRRAKTQQRFSCLAIVPRYECDGRNRGKLAHKPRDCRERLAMTAVD